MYQDDGVLTPLRTVEQTYDHNVEFEIVDHLSQPEGDCVFRGHQIRVFRKENVQTTCMGSFAKEYIYIYRHGKQTWVRVLRSQVPNRIMPRMVLNTLEAEHHIVRNGGFLLHSSFIRVGDRAILFTAPSGTGKSTQAELWRKFRNAEVINGDRTAVVPMEDAVMAYGIPYCGTSKICGNAKFPVAAIVCLSQAPQNHIELIRGRQAFRKLWEGCSVNLWDREDVERCIQSVMKTLEKVPIVQLDCTPDESAVNVLAAFLEKEGL